MTTIFINCQNDIDGHEFTSFLADLEYLQTFNIQEFEPEHTSVYKPFKLTVNDSGEMIVIDHSDWSLHLFDRDGNKRSKAGGLGNGPGEFQGINSLVYGIDDRVLVLDKKLKRLTEYDINHDDLVLKRIVQLPNYSPNDVEMINFIENYGYVGIFKEKRREADTIIPWKFVDLDDDLGISKKLFSFPGNETIQIGGFAHEHDIGFKTDWDFHEDTFIYSNSSTFSWTSVDMETLKKDSVTVSGVPLFEKSKKQEEYMLNRLRPIVQAYPEFAEVIEERKILPYFNNIVVDSTHLYFSILNFTDDEETILQVDNSTREIKRINVPNLFVLYGVYGNQLHGIDFNESKIVVIEI